MRPSHGELDVKVFPLGISRLDQVDLPQPVPFLEPLLALDRLIESEILADVLALRGEMTIIIVSHRLSSLQNCDYFFLMQQGRLIAQGPYQSLLDKSTEFAELSKSRIG